jgi:hypothetical protein
MSEMRAITVRQPWAGMIFGFRSGRKTVENRKWTTPYRGPLLIHAGSRIDDAFLPGELPEVATFARAALIGSVDLVGVCTERRADCHQPWGLWDYYHWILDNPRLLDQPIPYRGRQSIYKISEPEVIANVTRQLGGES